MSRFVNVRWDLGIGALSKEWARIFAPSAPGWRSDAVSAVSVALLAIPLSLAIALASGVPPAVGLISAIVAGVIASLFGGTPLAVTGPAAAMAVLVGTVVEGYGLAGLLIVTLLSGALQITMGALGFGRIARLVPMPVIEGFTAGIGAIILVGQLPRALGLAPPPESHVLDVITHIGELLHETRPTALIVALASLAICMGSPRIHPRMPGPLLAVVVPTLVAVLLGVNLESIGTIPRGFPTPSLPDFGIANLPALISPVFMIFALGSLESLLSSAAVDKLAKTTRHDPDQEFIGQGLANVGSALFGGIPVTSVIARSALNVQAGARTRRSALLHALMVLALVVGAAPFLSYIPVAALAGVLMSVALRMLDPRSLLALAKASRADAGVYLVTFVLMVTLDLIQGVQWGFGAALLVAAYWSTRNHVKMHRSDSAQVHRLVLEGPLTFLSAMELETLRTEAASILPGEAVVLDLSGVSHVDATGAEHVIALAHNLLDRGVRVVLLGLRDQVRQRLESSDHGDRLKGLYVDSEADIAELLPRSVARDHGRLSMGVASYRRNQRPRYEALFRKLALTQSPHTLFVTCADSRVVPNLITSSDPGELFILRNVGNIIPPSGPRDVPASAAGVEYAVGILGVSDIVVCGHSGCGAIKALRDPSKVPEHLTGLRSWLNEASARKLCDHLPAEMANDDVARLSALLQLDNLRTYPVVREREALGELRLCAWFFDIGTGEVETYNFTTKSWGPLLEQMDTKSEPPASLQLPTPAPAE